MDVIPLQDDIIGIGIAGLGCCLSGQVPTLGSLEYTSAGEQARNGAVEPRPAGKALSSFRGSPKDLIAGFAKGLRRSFESKNRGGDGDETSRPRRRTAADECESCAEAARSVAHGLAQPSGPRGGSPPRRNSVAGPISPEQAAAQLVAAEYFAGKRCPEPSNSLLDGDDDDDDDDEEDPVHTSGQDMAGTVLMCSGSGRSVPSSVDSLALEVGQTAHEYLEECFHYTEVSVLDRDKFNAIPEIVKSDFTITGHLGKGNFSDVFEVVCKGGQLAAKMSFGANVSHPMSSRTGRTLPPSPSTPPRRSGRGRRATLSESINLGSLARPPPSDERKLVLAMKCLRPQIRSDVEQFTIGAEDLVHETAILANLDHQNIIKLHGRASGSVTDAFVLNDGYFILLDRLSGTLNDRIGGWKLNPKHALLGPTAKQIEIARSVADALYYLHSKNIVFRDLKPDNVGFDAAGTVKLFDFGFAIGLPEKDEENPAGFLFDRCGTPRYMAPEVGLSLGYELPVDVYSVGMLLWEICALTKPFLNIKSAGKFEQVVFVGGGRPSMKDHWPTAVKEIIRGCWSAAPRERPTMLEVKSSLSLVVHDMSNGRINPMKNVRRMTRRRSDVGW